MSTTDDQLAAISAQLTAFLSTLDNSVNWQVQFLAGSTSDPDSFDKYGGKTPALGYYPVVNISGQTVYMPCLARMMEIALGGANAETLADVLGTANSKLALVDQAISLANSARDGADAKAAYAAQQGDYAKQQALAIGDVSQAVAASIDAKVAAQNAAQLAQNQLGIALPQIAALQDRVFAPKFVTFGLTRNPIEFGDTSSINLAWSVTDAPAGQKLNGTGIGAADRSATLAAPGGGWTASTNATLALFNGAGTQTDARTVAITPRIPIFAGVSALANPANTTLVAASYKALDSDHIARSFALARAAGGYPFIAYPASLTLTTIKLGGFAISGWASADRVVTLSTGAVVNMKIVLLDALAASASSLAVDLS